MPPPHVTPTAFVAALWDAKTALDEELDPGALRAAAGRLRSFVVEHPLAVDLDAKAVRGDAIREMFARACRGEV